MSGRRGPPQRGDEDSPTRSPPRKKTRDRGGATPSGARGARAAARGAGPSSAHVRSPPAVVRRGAAASGARSGKVDSILDRYLTLNVTVKVSDLDFPKHGVRPVRDDEEAVVRFVAPFKDGKYGENDNYISIAVDPECKINEMEFRKDIEKMQEGNPDLWPGIPSQAFPGAKFLVVDGAHRVHALRHSSLVNVPELQDVRVILYARRDKQRMVAMDYVTIGNRLNDIGTLQNQTTNFERVFSVISVIQTLDEMASVNGEDELALQMRKFKEDRSMANLKSIVAGQQLFASTVRLNKLGPLCTIALVLHREPSLHDLVKEVSKTSAGFGLVQTKALWEMNDVLFIRITIRCFLEHMAAEKKRVPPATFIKRILDLLLLVQKEFPKHKVTDSAGWDLPMKRPGATEEGDVDPLKEAFVKRVREYLTLGNMTESPKWLGVQTDMMSRIDKNVVWPTTSPQRGPDSPEPMDIDDLPPVPRRDQGKESRVPASPRRPSSEGSESVAPSSEESEDGDRGRAPAARSSESENESSEGNADKVSGQDEEEKAVQESEEEEAGEESGNASSPNRTTSKSRKIAKKGPGSNVARRRVEDQSSPERTPTPPPRRRRRKARRRTLQSDSEDSETPERAIKGRRSFVDSSAGKARPKRRGSPKESSPEITPDKKVTRKSKRLQKLEKGALKDDSVSEEGSIEETSEDRRRFDKAIKERAEKLRSLRAQRGKGKYRHIRVPESSRKEDDSGDSSDCDTDFEEKAAPVKWRMDEFYIPREKRIVDEEGFGLRHSWENGLYYVRPKPHLGVFRDPVLTDPLDPADRAVTRRTGGSKEWWRGTLPGGSTDWLYPDFYSRKVENLPTQWSLSKLPNPKSPEWTLKYRIPTQPPSREECTRFNREALLRSLGIRPPHQAHFRLTTEDILNVRWSVFKFLSRKWGLPEEVPSCWDAMASSHFARMRAELDNQGFLIMDGFVLREETDNGHKSTPWSETSVKNIKELFKFFKGRVPAPDAVVDASVAREWSKIRNKKTAARKGGAKNARWQSTSWATNGQLETKELNHVLRARLINEVACWSLVHLLHCGVGAYGDVDKKEKEKNPMLNATDSGSRVLITSTDCDRQRPHKDYRYFVQNKTFGTLVKVPGLFSLAYGEKGGELWIVRGSHFFLVLSKDRIKGLAEHLPMERVKIPPWSLFLARGDFIHAGISRDDGVTEESTRLHDYYKSMEAAFYDNIDDEYEFKPPF